MMFLFKLFVDSDIIGNMRLWSVNF